jgi:hypothetical protein
MRALFLLVICVVVGCATVTPTDIQDRGNGYYTLVASVDEAEAEGLHQRTRQVARAFCESKRGSYHEMASNGVEPTMIDFSGRDSAEICFRCSPATETPQINWQQASEACGLPYRWPLVGYR